MNYKNFKDDIAAVNTAIAEQSLFHADVVRLGRENGDHDYMCVRIGAEHGLLGGYPGRIYIEESDDEMTRRSLFPLLGKSICFVITGIDMESCELICSRKQAQHLMKEALLPDVAAGTVFHGTIVKLTYYGAYVDIGLISGLLPNRAFSDDHLTVGDRFHEGDEIDVICSGMDNHGRIKFRTPEFYRRDPSFRFDAEAGQIFIGAVWNIRELERGLVCFVRLDEGTDCLCPLCNNNLSRGDKAAVQIRKVRTEADGTKLFSGMIVWTEPGKEHTVDPAHTESEGTDKCCREETSSGPFLSAAGY